MYLLFPFHIFYLHKKIFTEFNMQMADLLMEIFIFCCFTCMSKSTLFGWELFCMSLTFFGNVSLSRRRKKNTNKYWNKKRKNFNYTIFGRYLFRNQFRKGFISSGRSSYSDSVVLEIQFFFFEISSISANIFSFFSFWELNADW